jgi:hypothetical protein
MSHDHDIERLLIDQALSGAVQRQIRKVIETAARTVRRLQPTPEGISGMRESQLRNVVNVAIDAQSVTEVAAFILYQMGRSTNSRQWLYGDFGHAVVADLTARDRDDGVVRAAVGARDEALAALKAGGIDEPDAERRQAMLDEAHIALARQYLGYLNRLFYYAERANGWDRLHSLMEARHD